MNSCRASPDTLPPGASPRARDWARVRRGEPPPATLSQQGLLSATLAPRLAVLVVLAVVQGVEGLQDAGLKELRVAPKKGFLGIVMSYIGIPTYS